MTDQNTSGYKKNVTVITFVSSNNRMNMIPDGDIVSEVLNGNTNVFEKLVVKYQDKTFAFCYKMIQDHDLAVECAHLAFVRAYEKLSSFRMEANFSTWLYRIAYNICIDQIRYRQRNPRETENVRAGEWESEEINAGMEYLKNEERKRYLKIVLDDLDPVEKNLVFSYYDEEKSIVEISEITGLSPGNIKIRLFRARKKMYSKLEKLLKDEVRSLLR